MREERNRWTGERIGRLGFLIGLGWDAKRIATDSVIASTPNNVHRQAQRFGLAFRMTAAMRPLLLRPLSPIAAAPFEAAAAKRGLTSEVLIYLLLLEISSDHTLIDNILDDDCGEAAA